MAIWAVSLLSTELSPRVLTAVIKLSEFGVYLGLVSLRPLAHSVLYLQKRIYDASPKAISERTSYFRVRLEFLRYPQVIPPLCNVGGFGPPRRFNAASACPWIGHPVSGLPHTTYGRAVNTRFPYGSIT